MAPASSLWIFFGLVFGIVLQPVTFAAYGRLPSTMGSMSDRLVTAAWAAVKSV